MLCSDLWSVVWEFLTPEETFEVFLAQKGSGSSFLAEERIIKDWGLESLVFMGSRQRVRVH